MLSDLRDIQYLCECDLGCDLRWEHDTAWEFIRTHLDVDRNTLAIVHPDCVCNKFEIDNLYVTAPDKPHLAVEDIRILFQKETD